MLLDLVWADWIDARDQYLISLSTGYLGMGWGGEDYRKWWMERLSPMGRNGAEIDVGNGKHQV
jgi:hypothetical protein